MASLFEYRFECLDVDIGVVLGKIRIVGDDHPIDLFAFQFFRQRSDSRTENAPR